jgi:hypothetical protein
MIIIDYLQLQQNSLVEGEFDAGGNFAMLTAAGEALFLQGLIRKYDCEI